MTEVQQEEVVQVVAPVVDRAVDVVVGGGRPVMSSSVGPLAAARQDDDATDIEYAVMLMHRCY